MKDPSWGRFQVRWDFLFVAVGIALLAGGPWAVGWALAVLVHELGHGGASLFLGGGFRLTLQLGGGGSYLSSVRPERARTMVTLAGPIFGLAAAVFVPLLAPPSGPIRAYTVAFGYMGILWSGFQLIPLPPMDGGLILQRILQPKVGSALVAWRIGWVLGGAVVVGLIAWNARWLEPSIWLMGMTLMLGRSEAGYVRHIDAYDAWERGDYRDVIRQIRTLPEFLTRPDKIKLRTLGVSAALEVEDDAALEDFADKLPFAHSSAVQAADALLTRRRPFGVRLAERAFDALDAEQVTPEELGADRWADLAFRLAVFEVEDLKPDSALGLLERAVEWGFSVDRIAFEPAFEPIRSHARFRQLVG